MNDHDDHDSGDFVPLSDQIDDDEIRALFTDDTGQLHEAVRHLIARAREDVGTELRLIDALELAVEEDCDETEASAWIAIILGEAGSRNALGVLARCLAREDDEMLQDAAATALLRIGPPAVAYVMDAMEQRDDPEFHCMAYRLLGTAGILDDEVLLRRVLDFLEERLADDPRGVILEELASASARLGHRAMLRPFKRLLATEYAGVGTALEDAIANLEANEDGVPFVPTILPWEERYGWLFEDERDRARVERRGDYDVRDMPFSVGESSGTLEDED